MNDREPHLSDTPPETLAPLPRSPIHVVLDNIRSAFNVGSIFRTSDGGAIEHLHLCGMTACPPHDRLARTALGATDYVEWSYHEKTIDAVRAMKAQGITVVAVEVTDDAVAHFDYEWPQPVGLIVGHEVRGVSDEVLEACDAKVSIPMYGHKNTMNVATAYGVVLFEILRQWRARDASTLGQVTDD